MSGVLPRIAKSFQAEFVSKTCNSQSLKGLKEFFPQIVEEMLITTGQRNPPIGLEPIAGLQKVHTIKKVPLEKENLGRLIPDARGFVLLLRDKDSIYRQRVTIAHELGHTLFFDILASPPSRLPKMLAAPNSQDKEEWLCYDFARELLMPRLIFLRLLQYKYKAPSIEAINKMSQIFQVAPEVICWRVFRDFRMWESSIAFFGSVTNQTVIKPETIFKGGKMQNFHVNGTFLKNPDILNIVQGALTGNNSIKSTSISLNKNTALSIQIKYNKYKKLFCVINNVDKNSQATLDKF